MWQVLNTEPTYGVCSICRKHTCGLDEEGNHHWIHCEALDDSRENIVIGRACVDLFAQNLGLNVVHEVIEVPVPPTDEQVLQVIREAVGEWPIDLPAEEVDDQGGASEQIELLSNETTTTNKRGGGTRAAK